MTQPNSAAPPPITVDRDLPCLRCGYNLRGLDTSGQCPTCGEAIAPTVRGDWMATADPRWRERLAIGCAILALAFLCNACGFAYPRDMRTIWSQTGYSLILSASYWGIALLLIGSWMITTIDGRTPVSAYERMGYGKTLRGLAIAYVGLGVLPVTLLNAVSPVVGTGGLTLIHAAFMFVLFDFVRKLARRAGDARVDAVSPVPMYGLPVSLALPLLVYRTHPGTTPETWIHVWQFFFFGSAALALLAAYLAFHLYKTLSRPAHLVTLEP